MIPQPPNVYSSMYTVVNGDANSSMCNYNGSFASPNVLFAPMPQYNPYSQYNNFTNSQSPMSNVQQACYSELLNKQQISKRNNIPILPKPPDQEFEDKLKEIYGEDKIVEEEKGYKRKRRFFIENRIEGKAKKKVKSNFRKSPYESKIVPQYSDLPNIKMIDKSQFSNVELCKMTFLEKMKVKTYCTCCKKELPLCVFGVKCDGTSLNTCVRCCLKRCSCNTYNRIETDVIKQYRSMIRMYNSEVEKINKGNRYKPPSPPLEEEEEEEVEEENEVKIDNLPQNEETEKEKQIKLLLEKSKEMTQIISKERPTGYTPRKRYNKKRYTKPTEEDIKREKEMKEILKKIIPLPEGAEDDDEEDKEKTENANEDEKNKQQQNQLLPRPILPQRLVEPTYPLQQNSIQSFVYTQCQPPLFPQQQQQQQQQPLQQPVQFQPISYTYSTQIQQQPFYVSQLPPQPPPSQQQQQQQPEQKSKSNSSSTRTKRRYVKRKLTKNQSKKEKEDETKEWVRYTPPIALPLVNNNYNNIIISTLPSQLSPSNIDPNRMPYIPILPNQPLPLPIQNQQKTIIPSKGVKKTKSTPKKIEDEKEKQREEEKQQLLQQQQLQQKIKLLQNKREQMHQQQIERQQIEKQIEQQIKLQQLQLEEIKRQQTERQRIIREKELEQQKIKDEKQEEEMLIVTSQQVENHHQLTLQEGKLQEQLLQQQMKIQRQQMKRQQIQQPSAPVKRKRGRPPLYAKKPQSQPPRKIQKPNPQIHPKPLRLPLPKILPIQPQPQLQLQPQLQPQQIQLQPQQIQPPIIQEQQVKQLINFSEVNKQEDGEENNKEEQHQQQQQQQQLEEKSEKVQFCEGEIKVEVNLRRSKSRTKKQIQRRINHITAYVTPSVIKPQLFEPKSIMPIIPIPPPSITTSTNELTIPSQLSIDPNFSDDGLVHLPHQVYSDFSPNDEQITTSKY